MTATAAVRTATAVAAGGAGGVVVALVGLNLRPAVTSQGALLGEIQPDTGMPDLVAALVVAAPVACFAVGGVLAWPITRRHGTHRVMCTALAVLAGSLVVRVAGGPYMVLGGTVTVCLAIAVLATLLPPIVQTAAASRRHVLTACYAVALGCGSAVGALLTPWIAERGGSWRWAAASWSLLAAVALVAWLTRRPDLGPPGRRRHVGRTRLAPAGVTWALTVYFGLLSAFAFVVMGWYPTILRDLGVPPGEITWLFAVAMILGLPGALFVPTRAARRADQAGLVLLFAIPSTLGTTGLLLAPTWAPLLWSALIGAGMPAVVLGLTLIQLRVADVDTAGALSSRVQGVGYGIAGVIALTLGTLHAVTGTWTWPLAALLLVLAGCATSGLVAAQPTTVTTLPRKVNPCATPDSSGGPSPTSTARSAPPCAASSTTPRCGRTNRSRRSGTGATRTRRPG